LVATVNVAALLLTPAAEAVICAVPGDTPVARPPLLMVATLDAELDHLKVIPLIVLPF
jgi:hypothetical protein